MKVIGPADQYKPQQNTTNHLSHISQNMLYLSVTLNLLTLYQICGDAEHIDLKHIFVNQD